MSPIIHITDTDSTNNYLKQLLQQQTQEEGIVVFADFQTAGKGQRENRWESEKGKNLLFSIVLYPDVIKANEQFIVSQIVSLGVAEYLSRFAEDISIKWPNDIYWKDKKICGILIENTLLGDNIGQSVCGIGININQKEFYSGAPNPVSLSQITNSSYDLEMMLTEVVSEILSLYQLLKDSKITTITERYKNMLYRRVGYHLYNDGITDFKAKIKNVESSGILVLQTEDGKERSFAFKEVSYK